MYIGHIEKGRVDVFDPDLVGDEIGSIWITPRQSVSQSVGHTFNIGTIKYYLRDWDP